MVSKRVTVAHPQGLHMRPAQLLVSAMGRHPCEVTILAEGRRINGKSILSILSACIRQGSEIELICSGAGERAALEEAAPDLIVMTGDLVNREDRDLSRALSLARMAAETAPAFFAPGNHEVDSPCWPELRDGLEAAGVQVLEDRAVLRNFRGEAVNLEGLWDLNHDPLGQAHARETLPERIRVLCREGALNVLLSHRPGLLEEYGAGGADVVFCGHAHGGQVRLPLVGPVFAPDEGLFPKHTAGVYRTGETRMVVSRGLGNGTPYPRLWNGPELVVVTMRRTGT